ncbi:hypothetical protein [Candidatus Enterococcus ferrettii]|uniref:WxL domain-containing protein n=1 Tax=Candidatus Enterococcus ferrettii TaxID=2815324 RepID=A0ABV0EY20_9ENTE|nr:hypothetical protein [Enterococcus sp. 665A]MBO1339540.1 hypothetical protein [Enterococcus sp. 665A]
MKKIITGLLLSAGMLSFAVGAAAAETDNGDGTKTVTEAGTSTVPVKGTLGADNSKPDAGIDEGNTDWVNVTVPSKTLFYSAGKSTTIKSPNYTIENHSGRPVTVSVASFSSQTADGALSKITSLNVALNANLNGTKTDVAVISSGTPAGEAETSLGELANSEGKLTSAGTTTNATSFTFGYSGSFDQGSVTGQITETYDLGLKFTPTKW